MPIIMTEFLNGVKETVRVMLSPGLFTIVGVALILIGIIALIRANKRHLRPVLGIVLMVFGAIAIVAAIALKIF